LKREIDHHEVLKLWNIEQFSLNEIAKTLRFDVKTVKIALEQNGLQTTRPITSRTKNKMRNSRIRYELDPNTPPRKQGAHNRGIPTEYRGFRMRSRTEANVARIMDDANILWQYEPRRFNLGCCIYIPDFWLPEEKMFVEVKGWMDSRSEHKINRFREIYGNQLTIVFSKEVD